MRYVVADNSSSNFWRSLYALLRNKARLNKQKVDKELGKYEDSLKDWREKEK